MDHEAPPARTIADMQAALEEAERQIAAGQSVPASRVHDMLRHGDRPAKASA